MKDVAPSGVNADEDGWADVGKGSIDWKRLIPHFNGVEVFVVEHDNPNDFERFARQSRAAVAGW